MPKDMGYTGNDNRIVRVKNNRVHVMIDHAAKFWDLDYQMVFELYMDYLIEGYPPYSQARFSDYVVERIIEE